MSEPIPLRMLNEVAYCPRLFALEHVMGDFADNDHVIEGRTVHRRVDRPTTAQPPDPESDDERPRSVRRIHLSDPELGLVGILDLVEHDGHLAIPIDYKKGTVPPVAEGAWEPERVQVCAQALLLRAHGYEVPHGVLYFAGSRRRVRVELTDDLIAATLRYRDRAQEIVANQELPPPLVDSPKCRGCSLVGICLPDEHHALLAADVAQAPPRSRDLVPARDDTLPLHVQLQGGRARLKGGEIVVTDREGTKVAEVRVAETSQVVVHGNVTFTTPLLHTLAERDIPVALHGYGGWYKASVHPATGRNVLLRHQQHLAAADPERSLAVSRSMIAAKIKNQRTLLRRNARDLDPQALVHLKDAAAQAAHAPDADTLRGIEGMAARRYFENFPKMLRGDLRDAFDMDGRNRRPPRDPINALLSFSYSMLVRELSHIAHRVGFDPHVGFLHTLRPGRPALALDLMEEMRPIVADSVVLQVVNNGVIQPDDVPVSPVGCRLQEAGRRRFIQAMERRLDELVTHPTLGTRWSYRRTLEIQARLLGKTLLGELPTYPAMTVR